MADRLLLDPGLASTVVAQRLLGAVLSTHLGDGLVAVRITETEAYNGEDDPASHAYRGERPRTRSLFGPAGRLYVYRHLGIHHCANLVCGPPGRGPAVLFRSGEVIAGADLATARRTRRGVCRTPRDLARGPGRLAVALGLDLQLDGAPVIEGLADAQHRVGLTWPTEPIGAPRRASSARIGVGQAGADPDQFGWRWWIADDPHVSGTRRTNQPKNPSQP